MFHPLGEEHIKSIARIQLKSLMGRLEAQGYEVEVSEALLEAGARRVRSRLRGASLKRAIQHKVENPLAQALLSGRIVPGKSWCWGPTAMASP